MVGSAVPAGNGSPVESVMQGANASTESGDDMIDLSQDAQRWPFLNRVLAGCRDELVKMYSDADRAAKLAQARHRWQARIGVGSATGAVCVGILELAALGLRHESIVATVAEVLLVILAVLFFFIGKSSREAWLTERNKAERCRLAKFRAMTRPSTWESEMAGPESCDPDLVSDLRAIGEVTTRQWLADDRIPMPPGRIRLHLSDLRSMSSLREYYLYKRLSFQKKHFENRSAIRTSRWAGTLRELPEILFYLSVFLVAVNFGIKGYWRIAAKPTATESEKVSVLLLAGAALLPTIGAGIHAWRTAQEGTRNVHRFGAKLVALRDLERRLEEAKDIRSEEMAEELLRNIWCAEQILESEHREWLRLMYFAEWTG